MSDTLTHGVVRVAAYTIARDADRILLVRVAPGYTAVGKWTLPGGGLNFGEHPADAALRELTEETGLTGTITGLELVDSWARPADPENGTAWHAIRIVYRVDITGGTLRDELDESTDMAAWHSLDEARKLPLTELATLILDQIEAR